MGVRQLMTAMPEPETAPNRAKAQAETGMRHALRRPRMVSNQSTMLLPIRELDIRAPPMVNRGMARST